MKRIKIIYKDYDFRHFCDDYEYKYPESYKNDIKRLNKESDVKYDVIVGLTVLFILSIVMHLIR